MLTNENSDFKLMIESLRQEHEKLIKESNQLFCDNIKLKEENTKLKDEKLQLLQTNNDLINENTILKGDLEKSKDENLKFTTLLSAIKDEIDGSVSEAKNIKEQWINTISISQSNNETKQIEEQKEEIKLNTLDDRKEKSLDSLSEEKEIIFNQSSEDFITWKHKWKSCNTLHYLNRILGNMFYCIGGSSISY